MGLWEDLLNTPGIREAMAQRELEAEGSVMAGKRKEPGRLGITGDVIQQMLEALNPVEWMGGPGGLAHVPQTFRKLGFSRIEGRLDPSGFLAALQKEANYPRYKQLVESLIRRTFKGDALKTYRGTRGGDPLLEQIMAEGKLPGATAVSLDPTIAESFARMTAGLERLPAHIARIEIPAEGVMGLVPRRGAGSYSAERELLINPQLARDISLQAKVSPSSKMGTMGGWELPLSPPESLLQQLIDKVLSSRQGGE